MKDMLAMKAIPTTNPPTPTLFSDTFIPREEGHWRACSLPGIVHLQPAM